VLSTSTVALVLAGVAVVVAANLLARASRLPTAVLLVIAGLVFAVLPGPTLELQPELVLILVIPPLLYGAALESSVTALRSSARTIGSLSVGLVLATALLVGVAVHAAVPSVSLAAAIALGAAVAPPDPVAALAIARRAGLPPRLVTLIEGEGLLNDATALTTLKVAVAAAVGGGFSLANAAGQFVLSAVGGLMVGLLVAVGVGWVRKHAKDPLAENALSLATPFATYLLAEEVHTSGVLAVVVAGLWFGHQSPSLQSSQSRLQTRAVWRLVEFLLEGFVFLLIGQQLPAILRGLDAYPAGTVVTATLLTLAVVLILRPLWLLLSARLPSRLHARLGGDPDSDNPPLTAKEILALSWAGTRGVITLAAVFSVPLLRDDGTPLPGRDLLLFCAYLVVLVTLIGQGVTFSPLLSRLRLGSAEVGQAIVRNQARAAAVRAGLDRLDQLVEDEELPEDVAQPLRRAAKRRLTRYEQRVERLSEVEDGGELPTSGAYQTEARLRHAMIDAEREALLEWRDTGRLPDSSLRVLQRELDLVENVLPPG
jgi:Na+/H+ antiporter